MKKIVVATDFSPAAHNAFLYAVNLGAHFRAEVILLHIAPVVLSDAGMGAFVRQMSPEYTAVMALEKFEQWEAEIPPELKQKIRFRTEMKSGPTISEILRSTEELHPSMLVMGMEEEPHLGDKILGNTITSVIQRCSVPVMVVPESAKFQGIAHIAYATNFELEDIRALDQVLEFAHRFNAKVHCVHIRRNGDEGDRYKQEILKRAYQPDMTMDKLDFNVLRYPEVIDGLNKYVEEHHIDLLVMLTHQRGIFGQLFHNSHAKGMVMHSKVPLWVFQMKETA
ncbi:MAG: universal stress protein [Bacteroidetes bacterium]|nr:MAG: universal stress protein [Bacteroidota bacterium]